MPNPRDLIQRLLDTVKQKYADPDEIVAVVQAINEARAYLATPEPVARPTDEELLELWTAWNVGWDPRRGLVVMPHPAEYSRAVLARYGHQTPQPIPLPERQPGPEDCDAEGRCWYWDPEDDNEHWDFMPRCGATVTWTHWLPHHALPLPEVEP